MSATCTDTESRVICRSECLTKTCPGKQNVRSQEVCRQAFQSQKNTSEMCVAPAYDCFYSSSQRSTTSTPTSTRCTQMSASTCPKTPRRGRACDCRAASDIEPILFIMLINPLIKPLKKVGGVRVHDGGTCNIDISSLWYADDGALLADSLDTAALMLHTTHTFFLSVGMRIGASKCGLLPLFDAPTCKRDGTLDDRFVKCDEQGNHLFSTRTSVDATEIPIVNSYKYRSFYGFVVSITCEGKGPHSPFLQSMCSWLNHGGSMLSLGFVYYLTPPHSSGNSTTRLGIPAKLFRACHGFVV